MVEQHDALREDVVAYALGALDPAERAGVEAHLRGCPECTRMLDEYRELAGLLPHALPPQAPPPEARSALLARVRTERAPASADGPLPTTTAVVPQAETSAGAIRFIRPLAWAAAAAALAGLLIWNITLQRKQDDLRAEVAAITRAADARVAVMANTSAAPAAAGRFFLAEGDNRAILAVSGLPPLPAGRVYQFWYFASQERPRESGGIFTVGARGDALVGLTVPGPIGQYTQIWVTQEPMGGSEVPTAPHFLEGPLS